MVNARNKALSLGAFSFARVLAKLAGFPRTISRCKEGIHDFQHGALIGWGQGLDLLEALHEPGCLGARHVGEALHAEQLIGADLQGLGQVYHQGARQNTLSTWSSAPDGQSHFVGLLPPAPARRSPPHASPLRIAGCTLPPPTGSCPCGSA